MANVDPVSIGHDFPPAFRVLHVDTGPADGRLLADRDRLTELFANLFRNAVEHGGGDVTVTVGSTCDGFYVADDGHGIPEEHRKQVLQSGYSTEEAGTGLGLSIVQQIADSHDWGLSIDESDAGGARFSFTGVERPDAS